MLQMPNHDLPDHLLADPRRFAHIVQPTLVVDPRKVERNVRRMADKAALSGVRLRPHVKTHNSPRIAELLRPLGINAITVSSVEWARVFADAGWRDITIAFPVNLRAIPELRRLAGEVSLGLLVDSIEAARALAALEHPVNAWLDIDTGYHRTGIPWDDADAVGAVALEVAAVPRHRLAGVLTHAGHSYHVTGIAAVQAVFRETAERMAVARRAAEVATGATGLEISVGDTPTCSVVERLDGVDEVRAGNYAYYDLQQLAVGACTEDDLAATVACPVAGVYPARGEVVVQGGKMQLSGDTAPGPDGALIHARVAVVGDPAWDVLPAGEAALVSVSQEHGVVRCSPDVLRRIHVGDLLFLVPAHACIAANLTRDLELL
jgi:D-serine deaminase-like pyridoxal phosphate-dependent protein